ncbi:cysteine-rich receptor-like protein kinase 2 [Zingiber officinale]|uniref:cysteine-rich receptor-like protein kinase 2 n=1 Tax=Zingiber officinale TaxID=94328 RepID=UPI001C4C1FD4|nr:cysteine-rich receptor-like protein kinase 2 [Zingiber officinale]
MAYSSASALAVAVLLLWSRITAGDPQGSLLQDGCSLYNVTDTTWSAFAATINRTFDELRSTISAASPGSSAAHFATAQSSAPHPVYALLQCRGYLSTADCLACFSVAAVHIIRRCGAANGARVIYDGCFLRYESAPFFYQGTLPGNSNSCGSRNATGGFAAALRALLEDLSAATPRTPQFFAAAEREGVFGIAQCVTTIDEEGCGQCLAVAVNNAELCLPGADGRAVDAGCFMRYSDESFFPANQTMDLSPFLNSGRSSKRRAIIWGVTGGVGGLLLLLGLVALVWIRRSGDQQGRKGDILGATELQGPLNFHYKDLKKATNNFSEDSKLGEGGFGDVYKGILKNRKIVAVKRLAIAQISRARTDFQSEVKLISNVHHRNLIRLLGCSSKGKDFLLVYEYMANSSLDKFIFGDKRGFLNWKQRFSIIVGMARGLSYLHQEFHVCIIHRDIKCSNILLDDDLQPRIADFGLARLLPDDKSHLSTQFAGTLGYTAPEYAIHGQLSVKVDTYSFGVVILEIISGRKNNDVKLEPETQYLLEWVWKLYERDQLIELVDGTLDPSEFSLEEVKRIIKIALLCTQSAAADRPTMSEIVVMLLSQSDNTLQPTRPTFIDATSRVHGDASSLIVSSSTSHATVSVSQVSAR